jgi:hypothetical protein
MAPVCSYFLICLSQRYFDRFRRRCEKIDPLEFGCGRPQGENPACAGEEGSCVAPLLVGSVIALSDGRVVRITVLADLDRNVSSWGRFITSVYRPLVRVDVDPIASDAQHSDSGTKKNRLEGGHWMVVPLHHQSESDFIEKIEQDSSEYERRQIQDEQRTEFNHDLGALEESSTWSP